MEASEWRVMDRMIGRLKGMREGKGGPGGSWGGYLWARG